MACTVCTKPVPEEEQVATSGGRVYHQACLRCAYCKTALQPADNLTTLRGIPYCKADFDDLFELFDLNAEDEDSYDDDDEDEEEDDEDEDDEEGDEGTSGQAKAKKAKEPKVKPAPLYILLTKSRKAAIEAAKTFTLLGQTEDSAWFNTMSGDTLISGLRNEIRSALERGTRREQFDALFALTYALKRYRYWIHDNSVWEKGGWLEEAIGELGTAWYNMLQNSDDELGIDPEITKPSIITLLKQFDEMAQEQEGAQYPFHWNGPGPQGNGKDEGGVDTSSVPDDHRAKILKVKD